MKTTSKYNYCTLPEDQDNIIGEHGNKQRLQKDSENLFIRLGGGLKMESS